jgi:AraC-like DNA-binding protein
LALYPEDVVGFVKDTQPEQWEKFCTLYPSAPEQKFLERVAEQLNKADPLAANQTMRTFGTLGVLRHELRDRGTRFFLCQFKPEHDLNPDTLARYGKNRVRLVPEVVYSPWATEAEFTATGLKSKAWRLWTLPTLARAAGTSRTVLTERFTYLVGHPPLTYLASWRLQLAARLLQTTDDTALQVALNVGYESEAAFNRAFKRTFGLPPGKFRREQRLHVRPASISRHRAKAGARGSAR